MFSSAGDKCGVHYLFRELTGQETGRTWDQLGDDTMDRIYENSSATWDESTVLSFLDAFLLPHIEKFGGGENGTKRTALFYDFLHAHRTPAVLAWYKKHRVDRFEIDANLTHDL